MPCTYVGLCSPPLATLVVVPCLSRRGCLAQADGAVEARKRQQPDEVFSGNAVLWALKKADESLDEIEENPPEIAKALYDISRGPVGVWHSCPAAGVCLSPSLACSLAG